MKHIISNCYYDKKTPEEAKDFIDRCYEPVSLKTIKKEYQKLNKLSNNFNTHD